MPKEELMLLRPSPVLISLALVDDTSVEALIAFSCPSQKSHSTQPNTVPALPQLTTETGETRS